jgi:hypothetical protein
MLWLAKCECDLEDYQDCGLVRWPIYSVESKLRIERVEHDAPRGLGCLYYRTRKLLAPNYDLKTGKCTWDGVRHEVILIRQTQNVAIELSDDCGALAGSFPDRYRGRWLVFSPAQRKHDAKPREPRPLTVVRSDAGVSSVPVQARETPSPASSRTASAESSDSDWLEG